MEPGPGANKLKGGFTSVHVIEQASQNGCCQCLHSHGEPEQLSAFLGGSSRSVSGSDPGSFQMTASALGSVTC